MLSRYEEASNAPYVLQRRGMSPATVRLACVVLGAALTVGSLALHPVTADAESDLGAIPFTGLILGGSALLLAAFFYAYQHATHGRIVGQPRSLSVADSASGPALTVHRQRWPASEVRRIELHEVPMAEGPPQYYVALVLRTALVELVFTDADQGLRVANALQTRLRAPPVVQRARPMFRAYALPTILLFVLSVCGQVGIAVWLLIADPRTLAGLAPLGAAMLGSSVLIYAVGRWTSAPLVRGYLAHEYGIDVARG